MADYGTIEQSAVKSPLETTAYAVASGLDYGTAASATRTPTEIASYALAGTTPPQIIISNPPPTTGQIWPRGNW